MHSTRSHTLLISSVLVSLLLAACGGGGKTAEAACKQQFWDGAVGVCLPDGWTVMERERLDQLGVPQEVAAAFQADKPTSGQFPNVTITREVLAQPEDSPAYSQSAIRSVATLPGYQLIDSQPATVDGKGVAIHIYTSQPVADQPKSRFYQISAVSGSGTGYTVTAFTPLTVTTPLEQQVMVILKSLTFEAPKK